MFRLSSWTAGPYSLRAYLVALCVAAVLPVTVLAGVLLVRSAGLERAQLEARLQQVAGDLADDLDRDIDRSFTVLRTLARLPSLTAEDWPTFYEQAKAALEGRAYAIVIDTSLRQLVNTLLPYGQAPSVTGDPDTARQMLESKAPAVSDLFLSLIDRQPVFNVNLPILRDGQVRYILIWGQPTLALSHILQGQRLGPEWTTTVLDRKGAVLARSSEHQQVVGTKPATFVPDLRVADRAVRKATNLNGELVVRAVARGKVSGWLISAAIPMHVAETPLRRSLWLWATMSALALGVAAGLAWLFARPVAHQMKAAADAALALGRQEPVTAPTGSLLEANTITTALKSAGTELADRASHQRLLLDELSHRVKNALAVVQASRCAHFPMSAR